MPDFFHHALQHQLQLCYPEGFDNKIVSAQAHRLDRACNGSVPLIRVTSVMRQAPLYLGQQLQAGPVAQHHVDSINSGASLSNRASASSALSAWKHTNPILCAR